MKNSYLFLSVIHIQNEVSRRFSLIMCLSMPQLQGIDCKYKQEIYKKTYKTLKIQKFKELQVDSVKFTKKHYIKHRKRFS